MRAILFMLPALAFAQPTWVEKTSTAQVCAPSCTTLMPGFKAWFQEGSMYDPISHSVLFYIGVHGASGIYASDFYAYKKTANQFIHITGTGSLSDLCPGDTPTLPNDRHPEQMAVDTLRGLLFIVGGVNSSCGGGSAQDDMYYMILNSDPSLNTLVQITPAGTYPATPGFAESTVVYDANIDCLMMWGSTSGGAGRMYRFCSTMPVHGGTPSGTLNAAQLAGGATVADGWTLDSPSGTPPTGVAFPGMVYADNIHKEVIYGGVNSSCVSSTIGAGCVSSNATLLYDPTVPSWTNPAPSSPPPALCWTSGGSACAGGTPIACGTCLPNPPMAYDSLIGKVLYHQDTNTGAPADWAYDTIANTWTQTASGGGLTGGANIGWTMMGFDLSTNTLIGWERDDSGGSGLPRIWQGALPAPRSVMSGASSISGATVIH